MITRLTFDQISTAVHDAYEACKDIKGGQNAHYIPYLANINPSLFGISLCLPDGRLISVGDTDYRFGIESVSKVHTAILALEQHGAQAILDDIGADAHGAAVQFHLRHPAGKRPALHAARERPAPSRPVARQAPRPMPMGNGRPSSTT